MPREEYGNRPPLNHLQIRELTDILRQRCQPILLEIQVMQSRGLADVLRRCCQLVLLEFLILQSREMADALGNAASC